MVFTHLQHFVGKILKPFFILGLRSFRLSAAGADSAKFYCFKKEKGIYIIHIYALILIYKIRNSILFLLQFRNLQLLFVD